MSFEKRNVVEKDRTPDGERTRGDEDWDKDAAAQFKPRKTACSGKCRPGRCSCRPAAKPKGRLTTFGPLFDTTPIDSAQ